MMMELMLLFGVVASSLDFFNELSPGNLGAEGLKTLGCKQGNATRQVAF